MDPIETPSVADWFPRRQTGLFPPRGLEGQSDTRINPPGGRYVLPEPTPEGIPSKVQDIVTGLSVRVNALEAWALDVQGALRSILECLDSLELEPEDSEEETDDA